MDQLTRLKLRLPEVSTEVNDLLLEDFLLCAKNDILARRYTFGAPKDAQLEPFYLDLQVELALIRYNMMGVEGQVQHSEGDINRIYKDVLLQKVVPLCSTIR